MPGTFVPRSFSSSDTIRASTCFFARLATNPARPGAWIVRPSTTATGELIAHVTAPGEIASDAWPLARADFAVSTAVTWSGIRPLRSSTRTVTESWGKTASTSSVPWPKASVAVGVA